MNQLEHSFDSKWQKQPNHSAINANTERLPIRINQQVTEANLFQTNKNTLWTILTPNTITQFDQTYNYDQYFTNCSRNLALFQKIFK